MGILLQYTQSHILLLKGDGTTKLLILGFFLCSEL